MRRPWPALGNSDPPPPPKKKSNKENTFKPSHRRNYSIYVDFKKMAWDSSVGIANLYVDGRSGNLIPVEARFSSPFHTVSAIHPAARNLGTGSPSLGKAVCLWRWLPTPIQHRGYSKSRVIPLLILCTLMTGCRVNFRFRDLDELGWEGSGLPMALTSHPHPAPRL